MDPGSLSRALYYGLEGQPITVHEYADICRDKADALRRGYTEPDPTRVATDMVGSVWVSTVWIGVDLQMTPGGPPLVFETMVLGRRSGREIWRYSTPAQARAGHDQIVAALQEGRAPGV